jgi:vacuolar-type H+-ATPase subunit E/Vma4
MDELFRMLRETIDHMPNEKKQRYIKDSILKAEKMFANEDDLIIKAEDEEYALVEKLLDELKQSKQLKKQYRLQKRIWRSWRRW